MTRDEVFHTRTCTILISRSYLDLVLGVGPTLQTGTFPLACCCGHASLSAKSDCARRPDGPIGGCCDRRSDDGERTSHAPAQERPARPARSPVGSDREPDLLPRWRHSVALTTTTILTMNSTCLGQRTTNPTTRTTRSCSATQRASGGERERNIVVRE